MATTPNAIQNHHTHNIHTHQASSSTTPYAWLQISNAVGLPVLSLRNATLRQQQSQSSSSPSSSPSSSHPTTTTLAPTLSTQGLVAGLFDAGNTDGIRLRYVTSAEYESTALKYTGVVVGNECRTTSSSSSSEEEEKGGEEADEKLILEAGTTKSKSINSSDDKGDTSAASKKTFIIPPDSTLESLIEYFSASSSLRHSLIYEKISASSASNNKSNNNNNNINTHSVLYALFTNALTYTTPSNPVAAESNVDDTTTAATSTTDSLMSQLAEQVARKSIRKIHSFMEFWLGSSNWWTLIESPNTRALRLRLVPASPIVESYLMQSLHSFRNQYSHGDGGSKHNHHHHHHNNNSTGIKQKCSSGISILDDVSELLMVSSSNKSSGDNISQSGPKNTAVHTRLDISVPASAPQSSTISSSSASTLSTLPRGCKNDGNEGSNLVAAFLANVASSIAGIGGSSSSGITHAALVAGIVPIAVSSGWEETLHPHSTAMMLHSAALLLATPVKEIPLPATATFTTTSTTTSTSTTSDTSSQRKYSFAQTFLCHPFVIPSSTSTTSSNINQRRYGHLPPSPDFTEYIQVPMNVCVVSFGTDIQEQEQQQQRSGDDGCDSSSSVLEFRVGTHPSPIRLVFMKPNEVVMKAVEAEAATTTTTTTTIQETHGKITGKSQGLSADDAFTHSIISAIEQTLSVMKQQQQQIHSDPSASSSLSMTSIITSTFINFIADAEISAKSLHSHAQLREYWPVEDHYYHHHHHSHHQSFAAPLPSSSEEKGRLLTTTTTVLSFASTIERLSQLNDDNNIIGGTTGSTNKIRTARSTDNNHKKNDSGDIGKKEEEAAHLHLASTAINRQITGLRLTATVTPIQLTPETAQALLHSLQRLHENRSNSSNSNNPYAGTQDQDDEEEDEEDEEADQEEDEEEDEEAEEKDNDGSTSSSPGQWTNNDGRSSGRSSSVRSQDQTTDGNATITSTTSGYGDSVDDDNNEGSEDDDDDDEDQKRNMKDIFDSMVSADTLPLVTPIGVSFSVPTPAISGSNRKNISSTTNNNAINGSWPSIFSIDQGVIRTLQQQLANDTKKLFFEIPQILRSIAPELAFADPLPSSVEEVKEDDDADVDADVDESGFPSHEKVRDSRNDDRLHYSTHVDAMHTDGDCGGGDDDDASLLPGSRATHLFVHANGMKNDTPFVQQQSQQTTDDHQSSVLFLKAVRTRVKVKTPSADLWFEVVVCANILATGIPTSSLSSHGEQKKKKKKNDETNTIFSGKNHQTGDTVVDTQQSYSTLHQHIVAIDAAAILIEDTEIDIPPATHGVAQKAKLQDKEVVEEEEEDVLEPAQEHTLAEEKKENRITSKPEVAKRGITKKAALVTISTKETSFVAARGGTASLPPNLPPLSASQQSRLKDKKLHLDNPSSSSSDEDNVEGDDDDTSSTTSTTVYDLDAEDVINQELQQQNLPVPGGARSSITLIPLAGTQRSSTIRANRTYLEI